MLYALQGFDEKEINVTANEIKAFLGILMLSGIIEVSSYRQYWKTSLRIESIASSMNRDKFEEVKKHIYFSDNTEQKPVGHPE